MSSPKTLETFSSIYLINNQQIFVFWIVLGTTTNVFKDAVYNFVRNLPFNQYRLKPFNKLFIGKGLMKSNQLQVVRSLWFMGIRVANFVYNVR